MKPTFLFGLFFLLASGLCAQNLEIFYDVAEDTIIYVRDGKRIAKPELKKGDQAILYVRNYNDYLYNLKVDTEHTDYSVPASGVEQMFSLGGSSDVLSQLKNAAGGFGIPGFGLTGTDITDPNLGFGKSRDVSAEVKTTAEQFEAVLKSMETKEEELEMLSEDIEADIQLQQINTLAREELLLLRKNPNLSPKKIKKLSLEYMERILDTREGREPDLADLLQRADIKSSIAKSVTLYKQEVEALEPELAELNTTKEILLAFEELTTADQKAFINAYERAERRIQSYREKVNEMEARLPEIKPWDMKEFLTIRNMYEEMKEHDFEQRFVIIPEGDVTAITIDLEPNDSARIAGVQSRTLNPIKVQTHGGLKVNASIGISFAGFFDRPQTYLMRDSVIVGDNQDPFQPIISSFFHFYPQSRGEVSIGGTFGLGIGLGGESAGLQTYFFGPSLILGKGRRIVLSTGLMGGKVDRLAQGYQVGDAYEASVVPTKSVYELGYFVGVSFNVLGGG